MATAHRVNRAALLPGTLDRIYARCIEDGGCLLWEGPMKQGHPVMSAPAAFIVGSRQTGAVPVPVRRVVWALTRGALAPGKFLICRCDPRCISHIRAVSQSERTRILLGNRERSTGHVANIAQAMRKRSSTIDMEIARAIRASGERDHVLAARYGISRSSVSMIRLGKTWREYTSPIGAMVDQLKRAA